MMLNLDSAACERLCSESYLSLTLLSLLGGLIGVLSSFIVTCTLVEITVNSFFSLYFGVLFLLISSLLYYRLLHSTQPTPHRHLVLLAFICLLFLSALTAIFIHPLVRLLPWLLKIPLYTLQGLALTFAFYFSLLDLINYAASLYHRYSAQAGSSGSAVAPSTTTGALLPASLINTQPQIWLLTAVSSAMGCVYGLTFAVLDVEDAPPAQMRAALHEDLLIAYPVGFVLGAVGAVLNALVPPLDAYESVDGSVAGEEGEFGL